MSKGTPGVRYAELFRESPDTRVQIVLDLDGGTRRDITTSIGFFDQMLRLLASTAQLDLGVSAECIVVSDDHRIMEEVGAIFGEALSQALSDEHLTGHAAVHTAFDDALVMVVIEHDGRGGLFFDAPFVRETVAGMPTENVRLFFSAVAQSAQMTLHIRKISGSNDHHLCEAIFKGFGRALLDATRTNGHRSA